MKQKGVLHSVIFAMSLLSVLLMAFISLQPSLQALVASKPVWYESFLLPVALIASLINFFTMLSDAIHGQKKLWILLIFLTLLLGSWLYFLRVYGEPNE